MTPPNPDFRHHYALLIGIDQYDQARINRKFGRITEAASDAWKLRAELLEIGYGESQIRCLCNEEATLSAIRDELRALRTLDDARVLVIFWAGHGFSDGSGSHFLLPTDADLEENENLLSVERLIDNCVLADVATVALFLDTCNSWPETRRFKHPEWSREPIVSVQMFGGASTYEALEEEDHGGFLSQCLREALSDSRSSLGDEDGRVHLHAVEGYLKSQVGLRAAAAWNRAHLGGTSPQLPVIWSQLRMPVHIGMNMGSYVGRRLEAARLEEELVRILSEKLRRWRWVENAAGLPVTDELADLLADFAHQRICQAEYVRRHRSLLSRALVSWEADPELRPFAHRLLYHCLEAAKVDRLAELTFEYLVGAWDKEQYARRLRLEFAVLDQLNSAPWAYGIRTRNGDDYYRFTPLINAGIPVHPGQEIPRRSFSIPVDGQAFVRLELLTGSGPQDRADQCRFLLSRRLRLPRPMTRGDIVKVGLQRVGESHLRFSLQLPGNDRPWWWLDDRFGFQDLAEAAELAAAERTRSEGRLGLRYLVDACMRFLNQFWDELDEEDAKHLTDWLTIAGQALSRRDTQGLKSALTLLIEDLRRARNESVVFVLESLLKATSAPEDVAAEFDKLARELLNRSAEHAMKEMWVLVEQWRRYWQSEDEEAAREATDQEGVEILLYMLDTLRRVLDGDAGLPEQLHRSVNRTIGVLHDVLSVEEKETLEKLDVLLRRPRILVHDTAAGQERALFQAAGMITLKGLLKLTSTPHMILERFDEIFESTVTEPAPEEAESVRQEMVALVLEWYEEWNESSNAEVRPEVVTQVEVLTDLLRALDQPDETEDAVDAIVRRQPLESRVFQDLAVDLRMSGWFRDESEKTIEMLDDYLELFDGLKLQKRQIDRYYLEKWRDIISPELMSRLPAEARQLFAGLEAPPEEIRGVRKPATDAKDTGAWPDARSSTPPEAEELLEELPAEEVP